MNHIEIVKKQLAEIQTLTKVYIIKANAAKGLHREKHAEIACLLDDVQITLQEYIDILEEKNAN